MEVNRAICLSNLVLLHCWRVYSATTQRKSIMTTYRYCLPSANHVPHIHRSRYRALRFRVYVTLTFDKVCTVLYPTCRTGFECVWKAQSSCKRHLNLHVSIPCHVQNFFHSPKHPDGICSHPCLLLKGNKVLHPWGIRRRRR